MIGGHSALRKTRLREEPTKETASIAAGRLYDPRVGEVTRVAGVGRSFHSVGGPHSRSTREFAGNS
jgi:hypothetical protein